MYDLGEPAWNLIKYLAEVGCPINETDAGGYLAIDEMLGYSDNTEIYTRLLTLGAMLTDSSLRHWNVIKKVEHLWSNNREGISFVACLDPVYSDSCKHFSYPMSLKLFYHILKTG